MGSTSPARHIETAVSAKVAMRTRLSLFISVSFLEGVYADISLAQIYPIKSGSARAFVLADKCTGP